MYSIRVVCELHAIQRSLVSFDAATRVNPGSCIVRYEYNGSHVQ
jgi:hypothetical protein